jgi:hypothetical protein
VQALICCEIQFELARWREDELGRWFERRARGYQLASLHMRVDPRVSGVVSALESAANDWSTAK